MFLWGPPYLALISLLGNPQPETPFWTRKSTVSSSSAGCPGKRQPRDTVDGGSKFVYIDQN